MEIHQLEAFEAIVRQGSFTRAADLLCLTQPAVTRQIAALEIELKTRLFDRLGRSVKMTAAGEALHRYAEQVLGLMREAREAITDIEGGVTGRLAIGASNTLATYVLPPLLRKFRETYPHVEIAVHTGMSAQVLEMVTNNGVDVGLVTAEAADRGLVEVVLADYETCVVVPACHPLACRDSVDASELADNALILMEPGANLRTYVDRLLSAAGVREQVALELDNVEAIKRMIEADLGISILPRVAVSMEVAAGRLSALRLADVPQAHRCIRTVYRRDKHLTLAIRGFIGLLQTTMTVGLPYTSED